jgi:UDP-N-acetylmuramoyl-L-alanyl-D-glutamate--2,6-diaminopimelate ligase
MISSIGAAVDDKKYDTGSHVTTPNSFSIQKFIKKAVDAKSRFFILEVTSHAIDQNRIFGIPFKIGVITNITSEHLDYHKTFDNYVKTKEKLIKDSDIAVVNKDDPSYTLLRETLDYKEKEKWVTFGLSEDSDVNPKTEGFKKDRFIGDFNKYNVLAAIAVCKSLGIEDLSIRKAIKTFKLPIGRTDLVHDEDFRVIIDFAHTPNAFKKMLGSLRPFVSGRVIHVFGSAGERDKIKRPLLGDISSSYSDILILTTEDSRGEDSNEIIEEIIRGVKKDTAEIFKIPDRKEAIFAAIEMAAKDDLVLITGKSQEKSMNLGKGEEPWDEYQVVKDALDKKYEK